MTTINKQIFESACVYPVSIIAFQHTKGAAKIRTNLQSPTYTADIKNVPGKKKLTPFFTLINSFLFKKIYVEMLRKL